MKDWADQVNREIDTLIRKQQDAGEDIHALGIVHGLLEKHKKGLNDKKQDHEFWQHCGYRHIRDLVGKRITSKIGKPSKTGVLPGFSHVQSYYIVSRGGDDTGVPVHRLWDDEKDEKVETLRAESDAKAMHADELERYKNLNPNPRPKEEKAA